MSDTHPDALAKLAEIPAVGSEERDAWLAMAKQHGVEPWRLGGLTYVAQPDAVLTLMSEARKQGQRDALASIAPAPIQDGMRAEARAALNRMKAREGEDVDQWAERLAADSVKVGEAEYAVPIQDGASSLGGDGELVGELTATGRLRQREVLEDWLVQNAGIGTWAAKTTARALLLRNDSPLVPASLATRRDSGMRAGATPSGSGGSAKPEPVSVSALTGDHLSRDAVDFEELNRLFALMPEGPWQDMRSTGGHEVRQIDTDPTNKHHWPFRLCQSIAGQRAACDDAVFAFLAGVLNAWPSISAANSDDAFIERTLAMPEDELRKRFLIDGKCPDQAAEAARQSFRIAELKVALMQISSQYVVNRHDMTDAEALQAIKKIADRVLGPESALVTLRAEEQDGEVSHG